MSSNSSGVEEDDAQRCEVITEAAIEHAMKQCGNDEAVLRQLKRISGLNPDEDHDCESILSGPLDREILTSTHETRKWVMCQAWHLVKSEGMTLSSAESQAWKTAHEKGDEIGVDV